MENNFEKLRVVRFIPTIVVKCPSGFTYLETSCGMYENFSDAEESLKSLIKIYSKNCKVVRSSVIRKVIEL